MDKKTKTNIFIIFAYFISVFIIYLFNSALAIKIGRNFFIFFRDMFLILPPAFILIGLFNVWVDRQKIERHLGQDSSNLKFLWVTLLAMTTAGGVLVALPLGQSLLKKGAGNDAVLAYLSSATILMIPMTVIEASIMGIKFSIIRITISIPLIIIGSILVGKHLEKIKYITPENL